MADIVDDASILAEAHLKYALAKRKPVEPRRGTCLWCLEPCKGVYCSPDCRDDHHQWLRRQS